MIPFRTRLLALVALALIAAACGDSSVPSSAVLTAPDSGPAATTSVPPATTASPPPPTSGSVPGEIPSDYEGFRAQITACAAEAPPPAEAQTFAAPDDLGLEPNTPIRVRIETSCGDIVVELDPSIAPETVNSFVFLAREGYFDGTASHRILPGFVLQAGDPTATGRGGPGYIVPDELPEPGVVYERGILAMANRGPGTTGSQFFVMLGDAPLPPAYSVFGRVIEGEDVLDLIAAIPLGDRPTGFSVETSVPLETLYLERVVVEG